MKQRIAAILRLEIRRNFLAKRGWWIYFLALAPALLGAAHSWREVRQGAGSDHFADDVVIFAGIFQFYYLRLAIFFGCVVIFMNLIRGEVIEKSLHYYLLSPVRREALIVGKYLSGVATTSIVFGCGALLAMFAMFAHFPSSALAEYVWTGPGLRMIAAYLGVTVLACIGYGAVFLMMGLLYRNPMIPAAVALVWESLNPFLPALLKKFSVIFYLQSLCPVDVPLEGPMAVFKVSANPTPPAIAIPGLLLLTTILVALASRRIRTLEISYAAD